MTGTTVTNIPGCFGSAIAYAQDSEVCKKCGRYQECGPASMQTLDRIRHLVNVNDLIARHRKARISSQKRISAADAATLAAAPSGPIDTPAPSKPVARATPVEKVEFEVSEKHVMVIAALPVKAQSFAMTLCKSGLIHRIRKDLANKRNPMRSSGPKWLSVAFAALLDGGFTRAELRQKLKGEMGWEDGTAASHTSLVVKLFEGFEISQETAGQITASPTLSIAD